MLETVTLDQLRVLIAIADAGSFTAASRSLGRAQSAISHAVAQVEANLGVPLFDRTGRRPVATEAGRALLADARAVVARMEEMRARARGYAQGLEAEVSAAMSPLLPPERLEAALRGFRESFPTVALTLWTEPMGGAVARVLARECAVGVSGTLSTLPLPGSLVTAPVARIEQVAVVAPDHPLAAGRPAEAALRAHVQIVLTDRSGLTAGRDIGVVSPDTWRVTELAAKRDLLLSGLGWGTLPDFMAAPEIAAGRLVRLPLPEGSGAAGYDIKLVTIHRRDAPPGPAGRWLLDRLARG